MTGDAEEVTETEREILLNALVLNDLVVRDIMTPRTDVIVMDSEREFAENLQNAVESGRTRFPLVDGDLDSHRGLIHIKDLLRLLENEEGDLKEIKRPISTVRETLPVGPLADHFQGS